MPRRMLTTLMFASALSACRAPMDTAQWSMGPGPYGNWFVAPEAPPPKRWSGATGKNIVWRKKLPETGQGGIAIADGKLFVATMAPWHIDAHCFDAATGDLLWTRRLEGEVPSIYSYPFSDATSASPCCDEHYVWFTNAGGRIVCFTHDGQPRWTRRFTPTFDGPFNKQFEPLLVDDPSRGNGAKTLIHMEPRRVDDDAPSNPARPRWNFLIGLDAATGAELWRSDEALTHYNAPILVHDPEHGPCVLHARGGPHQVPELPLGLSLTIASGSDAGKRVWRYEDPRKNHEGALQTMAADERYAYWLLKTPNDVLVVLDVRTGEPVREIQLVHGARVHGAQATVAQGANAEDVSEPKAGVFPARYSMHAAKGALWFLTYATAWGKPTLGAPWCLARIDVDAGTVDYHELPTTPDGAYRTKLSARAVNGHGDEVTGDDRSRWDGWDWVFHPSPTQIGDHLFFTLQTGVVYVIDTSVTTDVRPVAVNDLGELGATWTGNSISFAGGRLYHRTARELLCIGATSAR
ncbi:MAG: PQQ-binding-like beta-propeller repeat protein [Planctomycetes bacterium]|nr:PQQ-binding-like beta-propeller repeat protein [Planctomycetota bacterium]MCB9917047.1 PQQ-binding-like beta-propeller repeat protein [Planctomycetota bacterium]